MFFKIVLVLALALCSFADQDDKKWVWGSNNRESGRSNPRFGDDYDRPEASARYEVTENEYNRPVVGNRPYTEFNNRPYNEKPFLNRPYQERPFINEPPPPAFIPNERPGGVYGQGGQNGGFNGGPSIYGNNGNTYHPEDGVLTGPGALKSIDKCKCTQKFNCNSPGISYGHCDVGKQYCCHSTERTGKYIGTPSRPTHSAENGILVGPGGPVDVPLGPHRPIGPVDRPSFGNYNRGPRGPISEVYRPGNSYPRPIGVNGGGFGRPGGNIHSIENGILVGPGGPIDRPNRLGYGANYDNYARSAKKDN